MNFSIINNTVRNNSSGCEKQLKEQNNKVLWHWLLWDWIYTWNSVHISVLGDNERYFLQEQSGHCFYCNTYVTWFELVRFISYILHCNWLKSQYLFIQTNNIIFTFSFIKNLCLQTYINLRFIYVQENIDSEKTVYGSVQSIFAHTFFVV